MRVRYRLTFELIEDNFEGAEQYAKDFCKKMDSYLSPYARKKYPAHYLPHEFKDNYGPGKDWNGFIVWYYVKSWG